MAVQVFCLCIFTFTIRCIIICATNGVFRRFLNIYMMWWTYFEILLLCYSTEWSSVSGVHHYDVKAESLKLYGEDLPTVLKRFRRTPDYLNILKKKTAELQVELDDMMVQTFSAYKSTKLAEKLNDTIKNEGDKKKSEPKTAVARAWNSAQSPINVKGKLAYVVNTQGWQNRADEKQEVKETTTLTPVEILEKYGVRPAVAPVADIISYKKIAFEVASDAIHVMIDAMGPPEDESERKSTRMPDDVKETKKRTTSEYTALNEETPTTTEPAGRYFRAETGNIKEGKNTTNDLTA